MYKSADEYKLKLKELAFYKNKITQFEKALSSFEKFLDKYSLLLHSFANDELSLRYVKTNNKALEILEQIKLLSDESISGFGVSLFSDGNESKKMIKLLKDLVIVIEDLGFESISLEDSFVLEFRVVENGNDSKYQTSLDNIGSNGTDVLVKSMIYIAMVYIFKSKLSKDDLVVHTILDEIGILSQRYLKALIEFANKYGIKFINGAPDEKLIGTYKKVYLIQRKGSYSTAMEIISQN